MSKSFCTLCSIPLLSLSYYAYFSFFFFPNLFSLFIWLMLYGIWPEAMDYCQKENGLIKLLLSLLRLYLFFAREVYTWIMIYIWILFAHCILNRCSLFLAPSHPSGWSNSLSLHISVEMRPLNLSSMRKWNQSDLSCLIFLFLFCFFRNPDS